MGVVLDWTQRYATNLDRVANEMQTLTDNSHYSRVSHVHSLRDSVIALETEVGSDQLESNSLRDHMTTLAGGGNADSKHLHSQRDRTKAYFHDVCIGKKIAYYWNCAFGGAAGFWGSVSETTGKYKVRTGATNGNSATVNYNGMDCAYCSNNIHFWTRNYVDHADNSEIHIGFKDGGADHHVYFHKTGAGNLFAKTKDGGGESSTDTGVAIGGGWVELEIECSSTEIVYRIDGTTKATHNANIPDNIMEPWFYIETQENATKSLYMDYIIFEMDLEAA